MISEVETDRTVGYLRRKFVGYYMSNPLPELPYVDKRELAMIRWRKPGMLRHTSWPDGRTLTDWAIKHSAQHLYHSTGFFADPEASTMQEKGWLGGDIVFDIDCDHLPGVTAATPLKLQLEKARLHTIRLLEEFVKLDLAIDESDVRIVFSGGRGYHLHIDGSMALEHTGHCSCPGHLTGAERGELFDFVMGIGLDARQLIQTGDSTKMDADEWPDPASGGWQGRIGMVWQEFLASLFVNDIAWIHKVLKAEGNNAMVRDLAGRLNDQGRRAGRSLRYLQPNQRRFLWHLVMKKAKAEYSRAVEADSTVTRDPHRLIRLPGSLHGKTGLRCSEITADQLYAHDPLSEHVVLGDDEPTQVRVTRGGDVYLSEQFHRLSEGIQTLPEQLAVFLMLQRRAVLA